MQISSDFYISEKLTNKKDELIKKIRYGQMVPGLYVIYINPNTNKPEIMKSIFFFQKYIQSLYLLVIGITDNEKEAIDYLVSRIIDPELILDTE